MAKLPDQLNDITERFGPHPAFSAGVRLATNVEPDKIVKTHCCFCGQQCGIQLKVKDNVVIGFEPWEDFPFNQGMLCPKGVKRYMQGAHPDRLLTALGRDESAEGGFRSIPYDQAINQVASEIRRIQSTYGADAFGVLSGASLTIEKAYLMGKFARVALKTANIDYNGRLCMVSAAAGNKKAFGIDRAANPWSDILKAEVVWISGANVAECAPITTNYVDQLEFYVAIDFFLNESAHHADIVLPGSLHEEDEGIVTQIEGRVIKINKAVDPPGDAKQDWRIIQDIARAMGRERGFTFNEPREILNELRVASKGYVADYSGVTYEKIERQDGVFWPCPDEGHPGTPRLFEPSSWNPIAKGAGPFYFPDGKARFNVAPYTPPAEDVDEEYPIILTTGRVVSQFLSGTQTRRIGPLVDQYPEPRIEMHPQLAEKLGVKDGDWTTVESRRGQITLRALVVTTIRPDTIFIPYHWAGAKSANQLTIAAQDPISKIPEYKVCAVRVKKAEAAPAWANGDRRR